MQSARRWFAVGQADAVGPEPGARAAEAALVGPDPKLLIVFCSAFHDLPALVRQIRERSAAPLIGCTTAGEITDCGPAQASVVVAALGGEGFRVETAAAEEATRDLRAAGARVASCMPSDEARPHRVLIMLTDGLRGDQQEAIRGAYGVLGAGVPLVGGCAGDELRMSRTFQLHGEQVLSDSIVAAAIASEAPFGIGVRHGWRKVGEPLLVTGSRGSRVLTLDDRPALDMYLERLGAPARDDWSPCEWSQLFLTHPIGLGHRGGEGHVRDVSGCDVDERSLLCTAEIPQGGLVWIMDGDADSVLGATDGACEDSLAGLGDHPLIGMLAFDCVARRQVLGDERIRTEVDRVARNARGAPLAGFYSYGEIARTGGVGGFHNKTLVVLSVS
jgi:hypothetical protein